ncbi:hypothetical protein N7499_000147 [Penicillium canescens]|uniref:Uncharacterized protein n=1 Tax=Penicillium canescens TaxID=5083 RepID=A0AAD6IGC5_PENCN|nr:uncharacterized protein N7446_011652 [Penicillium canescens]KAJ6004083.1 hypothetical protein N7522_005728 [Penicillium canescens]KAJ6029006.1 hypothetical protein N7444_011993 [Penicillium canescens]KAJ6047439.1 hypothetical protein N7460_003586 [Penicillium canescens]KAJ6048969.1 hypothetical protein N7446_011652 [Penicillium canescens]KAJ6100517.1 hypothetical protein N7499_000147 [Penicillium canescens]
MSNPPLSRSWVEIRQALEHARDCRDDPPTRALLNTVMAELWARMQAQPDSYLLSSDEFALFNLYRDEYTGPVAQAAVARFWNNYQGSNSNGSKK